MIETVVTSRCSSAFACAHVSPMSSDGTELTSTPGCNASVCRRDGSRPPLPSSSSIRMQYPSPAFCTPLNFPLIEQLGRHQREREHAEGGIRQRWRTRRPCMVVLQHRAVLGLGHNDRLDVERLRVPGVLPLPCLGPPQAPVRARLVAARLQTEIAGEGIGDVLRHRLHRIDLRRRRTRVDDSFLNIVVGVRHRLRIEFEVGLELPSSRTPLSRGGSAPISVGIPWPYTLSIRESPGGGCTAAWPSSPAYTSSPA